MELNWTTFILEIINFLVLLWILKRFLYKPVLEIIARRQAAIEKDMKDAQDLREQAQTAQAQYDARLQEWQKEREHKLAELKQEIAAERTRLQQQLQAELKQTQEKAQVLAAREQQQLRAELETRAMLQATQFAAKFLQPFASAQLQTQLLERAAQQLSALDAAKRAELRPLTGQNNVTAVVATAYALDATQRARWTSLITDIHGAAAPMQFVEDATLLAGIQVTLGAWVLNASLREELKAFAELK